MVIGVIGTVASVASFFVGRHYGKKSVAETTRAADAAEAAARTDRQRYVSDVQSRRIDRRATNIDPSPQSLYALCAFTYRSIRYEVSDL